jgi:hypothetical protein
MNKFEKLLETYREFRLVYEKYTLLGASELGWQCVGVLGRLQDEVNVLLKDIQIDLIKTSKQKDLSELDELLRIKK